jgi:hypothetical protein
MQTFAAFIATLALTATTGVLAQSHGDAHNIVLVNVEKTDGAANPTKTNTTMYLPKDGKPHTSDALNVASTLYVVGYTGGDLDCVVCHPYKDDEGTVDGGLPFDFQTPARLSTNNVKLGSIVCE